MSWGRTPLPGMHAGESLDQFHDRCLNLSPSEQRAKSEAVDTFVRFLQQQFRNSNHSVKEVIKGGSLGKGTAVNGQSDIDLVVYFNGFSSMDDFKGRRSQMVGEIQSKASNYQGLQRVGSTKYSAQFEFNNEQLDILPAYDVIGTSGKHAAYSAIERSGNPSNEAQDYSASLAPLQIDLVKGQGETVKRAIRLLKYWKEKKSVRVRSYTIELVTIFASQTGYGGSTKTLFEGVLQLLQNAQSLQVAFSGNYNSQTYTRSMRAPYVLDPANPFMDTLQGSDTRGISQAARETLAQC